jgi:Rap1a immunity proteins
MKALLLVSCLLVLCQCAHAQSGTFYFNADTLATDCRIAIRTSDNRPSPSPRAVEDLKDAQLCIGYVTGAIDTYEVERTTESLKNPGKSVCVPSDVRSTQLVRVSMKYADDHPEELHFPAPMVVWNAMLTAFPCPK